MQSSDKNLRLVCNECGAFLIRTKGYYLCKSCKKKVEVIGGIPHFTERGYYFGDIPKENMEKIINIGKANFKNALNYLKDKYPKQFSYIFNLSRYDWRFILPINRNSRVLDVGAGFGAAAIQVAKDAGLVVALETTLERLQFLELWRKNENLENIVPILVGIKDAPLPEKFFDVIIMSGVLEWLGTSNSGDPAKVQQFVLQKCRKLLKDDGTLYIGIENRIGFNYFLGDVDHNGLRFTSLMPRVIANFYSKIRNKGEYRTYTYTYNGYKNLLKKAGFTDVKFYFPLPLYRHAKFIIPENSPNGFRYVINKLLTSKKMKSRILREVGKWFVNTGLMKHFLSSFIIVAKV